MKAKSFTVREERTYELALGASRRAFMKSAELEALAWPLQSFLEGLEYTYTRTHVDIRFRCTHCALLLVVVIIT